MEEDLTTSSPRGSARAGQAPEGEQPGPVAETGTAGTGTAGTATAADSSPAQFEQLSLGATVVGPGMRTEDHYEPGDRLKIKGERGVFVYKHASVSRSGLVSLHLSGANGSRAVRPDQVLPIRKRSRR